MNHGTNDVGAAAGSSSDRILILEDDKDLCEALKDWFEHHGLTVTVVNRGVEGLTEVMKHDFQAIICDMVMPLMPGDMFYLAVGKVKPQLCERFIFITGHRDNPDVSKFLWQFCGPTFHKPLDLNELMETVRRMVTGGTETTVPEQRATASA